MGFILVCSVGLGVLSFLGPSDLLQEVKSVIGEVFNLLLFMLLHLNVVKEFYLRLIAVVLIRNLFMP